MVFDFCPQVMCDLSSPTWDLTHTPCNKKLQPLDHQGSLRFLSFIVDLCWTHLYSHLWFFALQFFFSCFTIP